ncbi:DUF4258 domain-containing protein [Microbacterium oxydans]|uniref:DUF4258 domain-containing protein n=1 Tax=Microbacterium oxydans TaxID=82380 RepID=UPI0024AD47C4|nr:DUF4258 domain-containing protein [Microbacterium oxydans]
MSVRSAASPLPDERHVARRRRVVICSRRFVAWSARAITRSGCTDVPWAKDASGASVPTFYGITGSTLTQVVQHQGAAYPVVADPWWIPVLGVMARISAHAAQQIAARNISQNLIRIALQEGKRTKGNEKGTSVFSANGIRVVVNDKTGNIITVIRAGGGGSSGGR